MDHTIEELDARGLRNFGLTFGAVIAVLFGLFFPWLLEVSLPLWPWALWAGFAAWGLLAPRSLRPFYRLWMRFGILLSKVTTPIILGIVYYLVITPTGLIAGLFRSDPMRRDHQEACDSFRRDSDRRPPEHMENPF